MKIVDVDLGARAYPIYIGSGLLSRPELFQKAIAGKQVLIITNTTVSHLYAQKLQNTLSALCEVDSVVLPDGEQYKNLQTINEIYDELLRRKHHRSTTLIAVGGGVVGDMAGFAAATYQRGVGFIQVPTTLLAQVDSSVGGKTGVNHPLGKNMIGAFYQPKAVIIDIAVLQTLPDREFSAGLAEIIKYGLIQDVVFFEWLENNIHLLMQRNATALMYAIEISCRTKADIVVADEREEGRRALLNLGHTFGHAIEAHLGYGEWLHGEAVASGIMIAATVSKCKGWLTEVEVKRINTILQLARLPVNPPLGMLPADFLEKMQIDKKVITGKIRYVLPKGIGAALVVDDIDFSVIEKALASCQPA